MKEIKYVKGDILTPNKDENQGVVVCHQVNCKGVMGAGLAKQVRNKFPSVYQAYRHTCEENLRSASMLGRAQFCSVLNEAGYIIANLFAQDYYGRNNTYTDYRSNTYTDYYAFRQAIGWVAQAFPNDIIRIPYKIGCGLGGGNWRIILKIIQEELCEKDIQVEIWELPA